MEQYGIRNMEHNDVESWSCGICCMGQLYQVTVPCTVLYCTYEVLKSTKSKIKRLAKNLRSQIMCYDVIP